MESISAVLLGGLGEKEAWKGSIRTVFSDEGTGSGCRYSEDVASVKDWDVEAHPRLSRFSRNSHVPPFEGMFHALGGGPEVGKLAVYVGRADGDLKEPESGVHPFARSPTTDRS